MLSNKMQLELDLTHTFRSILKTRPAALLSFIVVHCTPSRIPIHITYIFGSICDETLSQQTEVPLLCGPISIGKEHRNVPAADPLPPPVAHRVCRCDAERTTKNTILLHICVSHRIYSWYSSSNAWWICFQIRYADVFGHAHRFDLDLWLSGCFLSRFVVVDWL